MRARQKWASINSCLFLPSLSVAYTHSERIPHTHQHERTNGRTNKLNRQIGCAIETRWAHSGPISSPLQWWPKERERDIFWFMMIGRKRFTRIKFRITKLYSVSYSSDARRWIYGYDGILYALFLPSLQSIGKIWGSAVAERVHDKSTTCLALDCNWFIWMAKNCKNRLDWSIHVDTGYEVANGPAHTSAFFSRFRIERNIQFTGNGIEHWANCILAAHGQWAHSNEFILWATHCVRVFDGDGMWRDNDKKSKNYQVRSTAVHKWN